MTSDPILDFVTLQSRMREKSGRQPERWVARLGSETALWLAAVPQWTVALAKAAKLPLAPDVPSVEDLVQFVYFAGVGARRKEPAPDGGDTELFWVDEINRRSWIAELTRQSGDLSGRVTEIADRVAAGGRKTGPLPALTRRWLDLVRSEAGRQTNHGRQARGGGRPHRRGGRAGARAGRQLPGGGIPGTPASAGRSPAPTRPRGARRLRAAARADRSAA